ncbi:MULTISPECIES: LysR family transcriptional regulator [Burkholderiaceae]|uniref:winged helix-turn-helix domain-containing protein n=1 Tax=Burkholderiaceae TaxID=119060 RepID=UPI0019657B5A|nr:MULTISPECIES: LysR family transcriptional regulator [Burkholderiaceae]
MADTAKTAKSAKPQSAPATKSAKVRPEVRFRMRIRHGESVALGPGKVDLLEAVREYGSISAAARSLDMSYRRAWLLIDELNRSLKSPATHSEQGGQSGGGCTLTPVGETIIRLYREVEEEARRSCSKQIGELVKLIRS